MIEQEVEVSPTTNDYVVQFSSDSSHEHRRKCEGRSSSFLRRKLRLSSRDAKSKLKLKNASKSDYKEPELMKVKHYSDKSFDAQSGALTLSHTVEEESSQHRNLILAVTTRSSSIIRPNSSGKCRCCCPDPKCDTKDKNVLSTCYDALFCSSKSFPRSLSKRYEIKSKAFFSDSLECRTFSSDCDSENSDYVGYYKKEDFVKSNWVRASREGVSVLGMAIIATATVIVHPLVFVAGAATAIWAVGVFHAVEEGYEFFTDGSFGRLFWEGEDEDIRAQSRLLLQSAPDDEERVKVKSHLEETSLPEIAPKLKRLSPEKSIKPHQSLTLEDVVKFCFPPLETQVVKEVTFPGLTAAEIFDVFFDDDAPYGLKEFQMQMGDFDLDFKRWENSKENVGSFMCKEVQNDLPPIPNATVKERIIDFKTLTNSYFGPTYAVANKTQRMTLISENLLILENKTRLSGIPISDRFYVVDRWIFNTEDSKMTKKRRDKSYTYVSKLTVYVQLVMLKSCSWEKQIRSKAISTTNGIVKSWCKKATAALLLAEKEKIQRIKRESSNRNIVSVSKRDKQIINCKHTFNPTTEKQHLIAAHTKKLTDVQSQISSRYFEGIELEHERDSIILSIFNDLDMKKDRVSLPIILQGKTNKKGKKSRFLSKKRFTKSW